MEKFHREILRGKHDNLTNLLAHHTNPIGAMSANRDDHLLHCNILEGHTLRISNANYVADRLVAISS